MGNDSYPKKLSGSATTTLGAVFLYGISVNKALTGTVAVNEGPSTTIATIAAASAAGTYHGIPNGVRYADLRIGLSAADDVTAFIRVIS